MKFTFDINDPISIADFDNVIQIITLIGHLLSASKEEKVI